MFYDIIIVGSGLVGTSLACFLKNTAFKIALIDKMAYKHDASLNNNENDTGNNFKANNINNSNFINSARALALSYRSILQFKKCESWNQLKNFLEPIEEVQLSKQGAFGITRLLAKDYALDALGYVINAEYLNLMLNDEMQNIPHLTFYKPDEVLVAKYCESEQRIQLTLKSNRQLVTTLLIAADGTDSMLREAFGIQTKTYDYKQLAFSANLTLSKSHQHVAFERFLDSGSIALVPFGLNRVKCIWIDDQKTIQAFSKISEAEMLSFTQNKIGYKIGKILEMTDKTIIPLKSVIADTTYRRNVVLLGNASQAIHPIAAQGFNLGLRDITLLAEMILQTTKKCDNEHLAYSSNEIKHQTLGSIEFLQRYAKEREAYQTPIQFFTHQLATMHLPHIQQMGILLSEWLSPIKNQIASQGMGL